MPLMKRGERGETIASRGSCMAEGEARLCSARQARGTTEGSSPLLAR